MGWLVLINPSRAIQARDKAFENSALVFTPSERIGKLQPLQTTDPKEFENYSAKQPFPQHIEVRLFDGEADVRPNPA